jgi:hypothetical protein
MEKKNILSLGLLLFALVVIGGSVYYLYTRENDTLDPVLDDDITRVDEDEDVPEAFRGLNLNLDYDYLGDNIWQYSVTGTLPNPCYGLTTEVIISEDNPLEVGVRATITAPDEDMVCAQVVQEIYEEGEFEAGEDADVVFEQISVL